MNDCAAHYVNMIGREDVCDRPHKHNGPHRHGMNPLHQENPARLSWDEPAPGDLFDRS